MSHGRQLRLFLSDGTSSGPRFYEIVNRTIQAIVIPATRIAEVMTSEWKEFQKPGVYLVQGATEKNERRLYIGKGENTAKRVQAHPDGLEFEVESLLLVTSKDENLNASQVGWLESSLITAVKTSKRIVLSNVQQPETPLLPRPELATVSEFVEDLTLIAQTAGFDFFSQSKEKSQKKPEFEEEQSRRTTGPEFKLHQARNQITAHGYLSDDGFVVKEGSDANATPNDSLNGGYLKLHQDLIAQEVLTPKTGDESKLTFSIDYAFSAPSSAAAVVVGNNYSGRQNWKTAEGMTLGDYLDSLTSDAAP